MGNDARVIKNLKQYRPDLLAAKEWRWVHHPLCSKVEHEGLCDCRVTLAVTVDGREQFFSHV